jgi:sugar-specific transcriptional regulator TrmB
LNYICVKNQIIWKNKENDLNSRLLELEKRLEEKEKLIKSKEDEINNILKSKETALKNLSGKLFEMRLKCDIMEREKDLAINSKMCLSNVILGQIVELKNDLIDHYLTAFFFSRASDP